MIDGEYQSQNELSGKWVVISRSEGVGSAKAASPGRSGNLMPEKLRIVLHAPQVAENVGAAARACGNFGCERLTLVWPGASPDPHEERGWRPADWHEERAVRMATGKGAGVLAAARVVPDLETALEGAHLVIGTTARSGTRRAGASPPRAAAPDIALALAEGREVAVVFGPEDRGLSNDELRLCGRLTAIPADPDSSSLNLAQAVNIILYEIFLAGEDPRLRTRSLPSSPPATHEEMARLYAALETTLLAVDFLKPGNPDYWMAPLRRFFERAALSRAEYKIAMGVCRQTLGQLERTTHALRMNEAAPHFQNERLGNEIDASEKDAKKGPS